MNFNEDLPTEFEFVVDDIEAVGELIDRFHLIWACLGALKLRIGQVWSELRTMDIKVTGLGTPLSLANERVDLERTRLNECTRVANCKLPLVKLAVLAGLIAGGILLASFTPLGDFLSREGVGVAIEWLRGHWRA